MALNDCNPMVDETYEFSAPKFFDFINGETDGDVQKAELWFETALSYAPSPFMPRIKTDRSEVQIESLCDFSNAENIEKTSETAGPTVQSHSVTAETQKVEPIEPHQEETRTASVDIVQVSTEPLCDEGKGNASSTEEKIEACTPVPQVSRKEELPTNSNKIQTAKRIASLIRNTSALKPKNQSQLTQTKGVKPTTVQSQLSQAKGANPINRTQLSHVKGGNPTSARSAKTAKNTISVAEFAQENQAVKRQKLDEGRTRQILNIRPQTLLHKSKPSLSNSTNPCTSTTKIRKEDRKLYAREPAAPFVSTAELVKRFQSNTRDVGLPSSKSSLSHEDVTSTIRRKPKLTLTRPVQPEFETSNRVRSIRVKSSAELEEEMMANIPKFKARPVNKKILEAPTLPALPRSTPQLPEFQEFHLKTMERANQHAETSTVVSTTESSHHHQWNPHKLTEPKTPRLETLLRARPAKVKSTQELEQEELEKMPKFKARPLNKKIFESKGDLGLYCSTKRNVTKPQEFHFATDERIPPAKTVFDLFDKLSLNSEPRDHQLPRLTTPNPFHLHTEERGAEKERKFVVEIVEKQLEEERARVPKATPYPYTTDYPVIPPKPEPKQCTKPQPFQLESLTRHEQEVQKEMEERQRKEKEEAEMRIFKAQPILREDPLPVPEKERRPLTEVQEFSLHVDNRAVDRAEFDKKIKEKEVMHKRYRDECESAKMMEEEKALKQMRRTMVPHARPVPNFDHPFHPQKSSKETTKPKSPNLRVFHRKEKRMVHIR